MRFENGATLPTRHDPLGLLLVLYGLYAGVIDLHVLELMSRWIIQMMIDRFGGR